ncbi:hypothetical protein [Amycolatopsis sp. NPDC052450]|uniref:hypothetical protein n=1 Tax=Amycolatopsis sp. NPDC052450 TaxID=3363937 RepID=UPI0037CA6BC3
MTTYNRPANLTWTRETPTLFLTEHNGSQWALIAHSTHRGKSGWSGTNEWHLHRANPDHGDVVGAIGNIPIGHGRWVAKPGAHKIAQRIAAWIIANPNTADHMAHHEIATAIETTDNA